MILDLFYPGKVRAQFFSAETTFSRSNQQIKTKLHKCTGLYEFDKPYNSNIWEITDAVRT